MDKLDLDDKNMNVKDEKKMIIKKMRNPIHSVRLYTFKQLLFEYYLKCLSRSLRMPLLQLLPLRR